VKPEIVSDLLFGSICFRVYCVKAAKYGSHSRQEEADGHPYSGICSFSPFAVYCCIQQNGNYAKHNSEENPFE
jgi:hypothetical protein